MNCQRFEKLIDAYLDGQLCGSLLAEFHAHRLACRRCNEIVSMLEAAGDVITSDRSEPALPADFADRVIQRLAEAAKARRRAARLVRLAGAAATFAAAAMIAMAVLVSQSFNAVQPPGGGHVVAGIAEAARTDLDQPKLAAEAETESMGMVELAAMGAYGPDWLDVVEDTQFASDGGLVPLQYVSNRPPVPCGVLMDTLEAAISWAKVR